MMNWISIMAQTLILDFDMTLVDSVKAITRGLNKIAARFDLRPVDESDTHRVMSLPTKEFWSTLWGTYDERWSEYFIAEVSKEEKNYLEIAPGAEDFLKDLKAAGIQLALATNRDDAWKALASAGLANYFDTAAGCLDVQHAKPAPDMLLLVMEQLQAVPSRTIYIGDAVFDMTAAVAAGIRAIGLTQGGVDRETLLAAGAWQVRDTLTESRSLLGL
jgi:HAD superfamily hydrolase (TIGR01509 family)